MAILNARSPRFRSGDDRGPDTDPPSRTSSGAGPAPNPGDFAGLFDSPSESTSTTSSTTRSPSSTGVSPGVFGSESDFASYTLSTTSSPTSRPTSTGGSVSGSASQRGSSSGGSVGGGLPPATIIGIVAGVVSFIFLSSFIHFWSRGKHRHPKLRSLNQARIRRCVENPLTEGHRKEALIRPPLTLPSRESPLEERQDNHRHVRHNLALEALPQIEGPRRARVLQAARKRFGHEFKAGIPGGGVYALRAGVAWAGSGAFWALGGGTGRDESGGAAGVSRRGPGAGEWALGC